MSDQVEKYRKGLASVFDWSDGANQAFRTRWLLGLLVTAACLALAFHKVNLGDSLRRLYAANVWVIALSIALALASSGFRAVRWQSLFGAQDAPPLPRLFSVLMAAQTINAIIPARVGDLARAYLLGQFASRSFVLTTVVVEKGVDTAFLLALAALMVLFGASSSWIKGSSITLSLGLLVLLLAGLIAALALAKARSSGRDPVARLPNGRWFGVRRQVSFVLAALSVLLDPLRALVVLFWSLVAWSCGYLAVWLAMKAVGLALPLVAPILVLVIQYLGAPIPSPGRVGTHQALSMIALSFFAVPLELAAAFSIVLYVSFVAVPLLIGGGCLWFEMQIGSRRVGDGLASSHMAQQADQQQVAAGDTTAAR